MDATSESIEMITETTQSLHASFSVREGSYKAQDSQSMIMPRRLGWTPDMSTDRSSSLWPLPNGVEVIASLVIDPLGRVREGRDSRPLSSPEDRARFLAIRRHARCIVIGSKTWQAESYEQTKVPVLVYSRGNRAILNWSEEIARIKSEYCVPIVIEAGPGLLEEMMRSDVVDRLYLTKTLRRSNDLASPIFDVRSLDQSFDLIESKVGIEDQFDVYQRRGIFT